MLKNGIVFNKKIAPALALLLSGAEMEAPSRTSKAYEVGPYSFVNNTNNKKTTNQTNDDSDNDTQDIVPTLSLPKKYDLMLEKAQEKAQSSLQTATTSTTTSATNNISETTASQPGAMQRLGGLLTFRTTAASTTTPKPTKKTFAELIETDALLDIISKKDAHTHIQGIENNDHIPLALKKEFETTLKEGEKQHAKDVAAILVAINKLRLENEKRLKTSEQLLQGMSQTGIANRDHMLQIVQHARANAIMNNLLALHTTEQSVSTHNQVCQLNEKAADQAKTAHYTRGAFESQEEELTPQAYNQAIGTILLQRYNIAQQAALQTEETKTNNPTDTNALPQSKESDPLPE
ncbi:MAG: hypothetical protein CL947_01520 [Epsilonproteobacteria bacterium]|nr:hypothetical protein [Campylobacterota bacterium]|tara:strand:+ start:1167 stop:2213 length:1047 start_codon:yes stop_codon:yes gene_type:complete